MLRILLVGDTSVIGSYLKESLRAAGEVFGVSRSVSGFDLRSRSEDGYREIVADKDVVVCAASDFGGVEPHDIVRACEVNVVGLSLLVKAAVDARVKAFILLSTTSAANPFNGARHEVYGRTRCLIEDVAEMLCASTSTLLTVLRLSQVYDFQGRCAKRQPFLYHLFRIAAHETNKRIVLQGQRDPVRNYITIDDVERALNHIILNEVTGRLECAHSQSHALSDVIRAVYATFGREVDVNFSGTGDDLVDTSVGLWPSVFASQGLQGPIPLTDGLSRIRQGLGLSR